MNKTRTDKPSLAPSRANLPAQPISAEVLIEKYAKGGEDSIAAVRLRVARALAAVEPADQRAHWEARFLQAQQRDRRAAGTDAQCAAVFEQQQHRLAAQRQTRRTSQKRAHSMQALAHTAGRVQPP